MSFSTSVASVLLLGAITGMELLGIIDRPVASVTCGGLDSLRIGMTQDEVSAAIGALVLRRRRKRAAATAEAER